MCASPHKAAHDAESAEADGKLNADLVTTQENTRRSNDSLTSISDRSCDRAEKLVLPKPKKRTSSKKSIGSDGSEFRSEESSAYIPFTDIELKHVDGNEVIRRKEG